MKPGGVVDFIVLRLNENPEIHPQGLNQSCTLKEVCGDKMTQVTLNLMSGRIRGL